MESRVVYHLVPTSNHNHISNHTRYVYVVYHLVPTSNHNRLMVLRPIVVLFIILFLHQTTTFYHQRQYNALLFIILFLHQTTTTSVSRSLSKLLFIILFLHQTTTLLWKLFSMIPLFIILFLHQTTTRFTPQPHTAMLFIILFLHQTTTLDLLEYGCGSLFIILFLHQTTTAFLPSPSSSCCLSSCSYIKPQQGQRAANFINVVYHLVPTSNHNYCTTKPHTAKVVYHLVPTSNHNWFITFYSLYGLFIILFLHQTTTYSRKSTGNQ